MRRTARTRGRNVPVRLLTLLPAACSAVVAFMGGASAQGFPPLAGDDPPCVLDKCVGSKPATTTQTTPAQPAPSGTAGTRASVAPGAFDFYVLALSWSPSFCAAGGNRKSPQQCEPGANPGFVVHGLWPQNQRGYPSNCDSGPRFPSRLALDGTRGLYPDEGLARHEWRQHGTCTGESPTDYFADVRRARQAVTIPQAFAAPTTDATWAPLDVARSFVAANRGLRTDTMAVTCRDGALQEVRICFAKDLRGFVPCPEVARASCRRPMTVPAGNG